jgi:hypothetical protein
MTFFLILSLTLVPGARTFPSALAAELAAIYPDFEKKLAELLPRLVENDRQVS